MNVTSAHLDAARALHAQLMANQPHAWERAKKLKALAALGHPAAQQALGLLHHVHMTKAKVGMKRYPRHHFGATAIVLSPARVAYLKAEADRARLSVPQLPASKPNLLLPHLNKAPVAARALPVAKTVSLKPNALQAILQYNAAQAAQQGQQMMQQGIQNFTNAVSQQGPSLPSTPNVPTGGSFSFNV